MWRWLLFTLILSLALPARAQREAVEPTPALRIDLRPYGYRTEGVALEYTQLLFLSDKQLAIKLHQEVPNHAPSEECKRFLAKLGKYASFPDCLYVTLPVETLVFDSETGTLHARKETRNRFGRTLFRARGGRLIVQTELALVLYSSELEPLVTYRFRQKGAVAPEISLEGGRIGLLQDRLVILDTGTLTPVGSVERWQDDHSIGEEGVLIRRKTRQGNAFYYAPVPGEEERLVYQDSENGRCVPIAWFLDTTRVFISGCRKKVTVSTQGAVLCTEGALCWKKHSVPAERVLENYETYRFWTRVRHFPLEDFGKLPPDVRIVQAREVGAGAKRFELRTEHYPGNPDAALSPDGRRVALIQDGFLEIYLLPPTSAPPPASSPIP